MKRVVFFFLFLLLSWGVLPQAMALTPDQYALQVLQKDVPRSLRWFGRITQAHTLSQVEVYELYREALPEAQENQQEGISVKGSVDRMILLLDGARYFEQVQKAPVEFQNKKEMILRILQATKDEMDRFQFGEDPQNLLEEWQGLGVKDFEKFTADLVETYIELQKILGEPVMVAVEQKVDAQIEAEDAMGNDSGVEVVENAPQEEPSFEKQRFDAYIQSAEAGKIAGECQGALLWKTDQAESCQNDSSLECDRNYARQCKKLQ
jgi:hypothetical protein